MPVVINELEVSPGTQESGGSATPKGGSAATQPDPREIERALERQVERWMRVRAH